VIAAPSNRAQSAIAWDGTKAKTKIIHRMRHPFPCDYRACTL
jgi:hypothetical protein